MTILQSIILGIVQGLSEFLPISSSAHLVIFPYLLGWEIPPNEAFVFNILVQNATLLAVVIYFRKDLAQMWQAVRRSWIHREIDSEPATRTALMLVVATLPALVIGLLLSWLVKRAFAAPLVTAVFLVVNSIILIFAEYIGHRSRSLEQLEVNDAVWIGIAQTLAIFPGISRSGSTIAGGMARNLVRVAAAKFSFMLSIPVMMAAGLYAMLALLSIPHFWSLIPVFLPGFATAAVVGYLSIRWLLKYLAHASLVGFAIYCLLAALTVIGYSFLS